MDPLFQTLRARLKDYCLHSSPHADFLGPLPHPRPDGSLEGIDYTDRTRGSAWSPMQHLAVMRRLAAESPEEGAKMLDFWAAHDSTSDNWWHQSIGTPLAICQTLFLLDRTAEKDSPLGIILERSKPGMTAQNRIWLAGIHLMKGVLYEDLTMVREGREEILSELKTARPGEEGIQSDFSFHQHGPQLQSGNYGLSFFHDMTCWSVVLAGTELAFPPGKIRILADYFEKGLRWTLYGNIMDLHSCGRQIIKDSPERKRKIILSDAGLLVRAGVLENSLLPVSGSVYFPASAYLIHRTEDLFFSVKMCTPNIIGSETVNSENMLGRYSADGATDLYGKEFVYDPLSTGLRSWRMVPGTTEVQDEETLLCEGKRNTQGSACGIADGSFSCCALRFRNERLSADKVWFCFGNTILCAGFGITSKADFPVVTTLLQTVKKSPVTIPVWNKEETPRVMPPGLYRFPGKMSFQHDHFVYELPQEEEFVIVQKPVRSDWKNINAELPEIPISGEMVTGFIDHGRRPENASYLYVIHPENEDSPEMETVHGTSPDIFAVRDPRSGTVMIVFFSPGKICLRGIGSIEECVPSLHLIRTGSYRISRL